MHSFVSQSPRMYMKYSRDGNGKVSLRARWRVLHRNQFSVHVTIQLIVDVEIPLVLQGRATGGTAETVYMQVLVLNTHEDATARVGISVWFSLQYHTMGKIEKMRN